MSSEIPDASIESEDVAVIHESFIVDRRSVESESRKRPVLNFESIVANAGIAVEQVGRIVRAYGTTVHVSGLNAKIGQRCRITNPGEQKEILGDVVGIVESSTILFLLGVADGVSNRSEVRLVSEGRTLSFSESLAGCILDGSGRIVYQPHALKDPIDVPIVREAPDALLRRPIDQVFGTGVKAIDTMLTMGVGQRVGIFAAAGGGKSTLLSMLARHSEADVIVIALIGERGREVREFIELYLGAEGLAKSVVVVSTSDRPAMERVNAAQCATTIAEGYRARGKSVLLLMDSVTRYARALREIGLSVGELPARRGYPPSVFADLPRLLERTGNNETGSITAFYTVLEEDEQTSDPVAEEVRSILDGHILLTRRLGEKGHYPAIDVLASASRLFLKLASPDHQQASSRVRQLLHKYQELELLIQIGEYQRGNDVVADDAVDSRIAIEALLRQSAERTYSFEDALDILLRI